jgi:hypothetical protein
VPSDGRSLLGRSTMLVVILTIWPLPWSTICRITHIDGVAPARPQISRQWTVGAVAA